MDYETLSNSIAILLLDFIFPYIKRRYLNKPFGKCMMHHERIIHHDPDPELSNPQAVALH